MYTITIDAMGGDHGINITVPASLSALKKHPKLKLILVGDETKLKKALSHKSYDKNRLSIQHASEVVEMDELPSQALRMKKDSSMRVAINLVKEGKASASVSAGNTGALMATSRFVLKMLPGVDRPAIVYPIPGFQPKTGKFVKVYMLDLGANVGCDATQLFQFGVMGSVLAKSCEDLDQPRVALLNIGEEEMKGLESIKQAGKMLSACDDINYQGFVEGDDIFTDKADVIVCDGFVGNVALKTTEGAVKLVGRIVKKAITRGILGKLFGFLAIPVLLRMKKDLDLSNFNGASFLGLRGIVVKSHGGAKAKAFATAIDMAIKEVEKDIPKQIHKQVELVLESEPVYTA